MDFADVLLNRINGEAETKRNNSALVCFSSLETGKILNRMAAYITRSKSEKSSITLLYLMDKAEVMHHGEKMDEYQHKIIADFIPTEERDKITLRLFIRPSDNCYADILKISEEQKSNLILIGIGNNEFNPQLVRKYGQLKNDPANSDIFILEQLEEKEAGMLRNINTLFNRNTVSTSLFIDKGVAEFRKLFIPILHKADIHIFTYLYRIAQQENVKVMVWDAIGLIQSDPKIQKLYQFIVKKTDGRICLWNDNKKIECDFIKEQDLIVISTEGWDKLVCTPLQWTDCLPSTLIIKEKTNSIQ
jgi:hypothetical protein